MHIPIVVALRRRYLVWLYKLAIHLQSFPPLIEIENTTLKGSNTLFDFLLDYSLIKTTVGILILGYQESMITHLSTTS